MNSSFKVVVWVLLVACQPKARHHEDDEQEPNEDDGTSQVEDEVDPRRDNSDDDPDRRNPGTSEEPETPAPPRPRVFRQTGVFDGEGTPGLDSFQAILPLADGAVALSSRVCAQEHLAGGDHCYAGRGDSTALVIARPGTAAFVAQVPGVIQNWMPLVGEGPALFATTTIALGADSLCSHSVNVFAATGEIATFPVLTLPVKPGMDFCAAERAITGPFVVSQGKIAVAVRAASLGLSDWQADQDAAPAELPGRLIVADLAGGTLEEVATFENERLTNQRDHLVVHAQKRTFWVTIERPYSDYEGPGRLAVSVIEAAHVTQTYTIDLEPGEVQASAAPDALEIVGRPYSSPSVNDGAVAVLTKARLLILSANGVAWTVRVPESELDFRTLYEADMQVVASGEIFIKQVSRAEFSGAYRVVHVLCDRTSAVVEGGRDRPLSLEAGTFAALSSGALFDVGAGFGYWIDPSGTGREVALAAADQADFVRCTTVVDGVAVVCARPVGRLAQVEVLWLEAGEVIDRWLAPARAPDPAAAEDDPQQWVIDLAASSQGRIQVLIAHAGVFWLQR